jgi:uncharacterized SAM-binding protein YcdF (DUF218 family)
LRWSTGPIAVATLALMAGLVVFAAFIGHYTPRNLSPAIAQPTDGILVLTGGDRRVGEGLRLLGEGHGRRVLISGVNVHTTIEDLQRRSALSADFFKCCVDVGYAALDTIGNAEEARAWAATWGFRRLLVVTSNYHMPRALVELAREVPHIELVPHPVVSRTYRAQTWWLHPTAARIVVGEYLKFLPAVARLGLSRLLPVGSGSHHDAIDPMSIGPSPFPTALVPSH